MAPRRFILVAALPSALAVVTVAYLPAPSLPSHWTRDVHRDVSVALPGSYPGASSRQSLLPRSFGLDQRRITTIHALATSGEDTDTDDLDVTGVTLKMAFDASPAWGVADLSETKSERFTSPESLDMVHRLRRDSSAVLVGRGTVERDDCSLTVRRVELGEGKSQPVRVVLDPSLRIVDGDYTLLKDGLPTIIYYLQDEASDERAKAVRIDDAVSLVGLSPSNENVADCGKWTLSPSEVIKDLAGQGLNHIMVEGGPATARAFLEASAVDRAILVRAPIEFEIPVPAGMDQDTLKRAGLTLVGTSDMGGDVIEYWARDGLAWPRPELEMWP